MVLKVEKREFSALDGVEGGCGELILEMVADKRVNPSNVKLYAHAKLEPGSSIGYHVHRGESEIYYILSGKGLYDDNGTKREVAVGDVTFTPDGEGHSLENIGDCVLEFMAIINTDEK